MSGRTVVGSNATAAAMQPSGNSTGIAWRVAVAVVVPVLVVALLAWLVGAMLASLLYFLSLLYTDMSMTQA
jgi:uncharacterized membrane protein YjfL (UPF0719 family)